MSSRKPILCLDFDGVIHSYTSGWKGADQIPDPPVAGAMAFIEDATRDFEVHVYSSRSGQPGGLQAMKGWLRRHLTIYFENDPEPANALLGELKFPHTKPAAFVSLDDRAVTFRGIFPEPKELKQFRTWQGR